MGPMPHFFLEKERHPISLLSPLRKHFFIGGREEGKHSNIQRRKDLIDDSLLPSHTLFCRRGKDEELGLILFISSREEEEEEEDLEEEEEEEKK